ncbi:hypothetical protein SLEP1_g41318 [Rubroshorea leprosula]|uniref:Uncharacterized protein n=1 Tax=Rubroshorea leprosula TaxID=152421 RepID=A0AAV5L687_9ROSI|nr:hypothetical protein SLEP1_g41318 [Rubroshorea leprosula]
MDSATTTAAGDKPIIVQAMARVGKEVVLRNIWLIIRCDPQEGIFETFNGIGPPEDKERFGSTLLGTSSIFVKSSLYAVGGRKPNSDEVSSCIRYLDTNKLLEGWKVGTLPSSSFDSVLGVYDDSIYILPGMWKYGYYGMDEDTYRTEQRGYIWNTTDNQCRQDRIRPPEDGGERQWRRIRACAALDGQGLLIAMDGEKNNFFLYDQENKDWKSYYIEDPLPKFFGETSFAASNGRLYILEVPSMFPAFLYIYDIEKRKLVMAKMPIPNFDDDLWSMDKWDRVVRLVSVADDKLCFLWLGPVTYENEDMWHPVRILHYLKVKFSINPNPSNSEVEVEDDKGFHTNITKLLYCLPGSYPEQFEAELEGRSPLYLQLDASQKQRTDNSSTEEIGTSLISGKQFQNQAKDIASPIEKVKRKRTQLVDPPLSRHEQKRAKDREWRLKRKTQMAELKKKLEQLEKDSVDFRFEAHLSEARLKAEVSEARLKAEVSEARLKAEVSEAQLEAAAVREAKLEAAVREAKLEAEVRALKKEVRDLKWEAGFQGQIREVEKHQNRFDKLQVSQGGEWGKNEEPSSTIYETVSPSEVPKQQHLEAEKRKAELETEVRKAELEAEKRKAELEAEVNEAWFYRQLSEAEKQLTRFDKLQVSHSGEHGKNETPSSTIHETISSSEVPKQKLVKVNEPVSHLKNRK